MSRPIYDVAVIGGGILALATARELATRASVVVLEAESQLASHQSGRNSGVVHAGLYYRPGSLKARLCRDGRQALERFCREQEIPFDRRGKLVIASRESELPQLDELELRGRANGLRGIERLDADEIRRREPEAVGIAGLWVPQTGLVDYRQVSFALAEDARSRGVRISTSSRVLSIGRQGRDLRLQTRSETVLCRRLVACAGLQSDRIARRAGIEPPVRIVPFRGDYFEIRPERRNLVHHPVYPVPDPRFPFLGVHLTPTIDQRLEAGPNAVLALARDRYVPPRLSLRDAADTLTFPGTWHLARRYWRTGAGEALRALSRRRFAAALAELVPAVGPEDLGPTRCGIRAQAVGPDGRLCDDFELLDEDHGLFVLNAPSPAATASLAIGRFLAERVLARLDGTPRTDR